jgi:hypothetical protein
LPSLRRRVQTVSDTRPSSCVTDIGGEDDYTLPCVIEIWSERIVSSQHGA